ncbi:MAG: cysteine desulfurase [Cyclobacteriaceae bacterium]|nr:cysteine desulfurase [Cyclobacteriaceae bacterium SS2]
MNVYFDNAATTPLDPKVIEEMLPFWQQHYGNPSSIHSMGRKTKSAIEQARKKVADLLSTSPSEIFFTSGGTEADNTALTSAVETYQIENIITSPLEHHAVLHTVEHLEKTGKIKRHLLDVDEKGNLDLAQLAGILATHDKCLVSLMHGNNEIGNLLDIQAVGELCKEYGAMFHSDTVQTMGHFTHVLKHLPVDFIAGAAHKFHGPKGAGFLYINHQVKINPLIQGGAQERNMRGGTENVTGIVGLAKALELAYQNMNNDHEHISKLKSYMIEQLKTRVQGVQFNGLSADPDNSLYTVLNVSFPAGDHNEMMLFNLDINGICASGGSACSSGSSLGSHVLKAINSDPTRGAVRFSFSRFNTTKEVDYVVNKIAEIVPVSA